MAGEIGRGGGEAVVEIKGGGKRIEPLGWDPTLRVDWIPRVTIDSRRQRHVSSGNEIALQNSRLSPHSSLHPSPISSLLLLFLRRVRFSRSRDFVVLETREEEAVSASERGRGKR